jgi:hypothetical protein
MIVEFSVKNFRSIKELQTISFATTGLKSPSRYSDIDKNNISSYGGINLFKTIGVYGANASGKSNIIKALDYFIKIITREPSSESNMSNLSDPFLYQDDYSKTESFFQIVLIINNIKYRYGLMLKENSTPKAEDDTYYSREIITNEWLHGRKENNSNAVNLFTREGDKITNNLENKAKIPSSLSYKHSLFITHAAAFDNSGVCQKIRDYLRRKTTSNFDNTHDKFRRMSVSYIEDEKNGGKQKFLTLLSTFNLKYEDVILQKDNDSDQLAIFPQNKISLKKHYKNSENSFQDRELNLFKNESAGTQKLFDLAGLLLRAFTLPTPGFIILDEIDSNFHPSLLIKLVKLFNNPEINRSNSQLLFTSHDTNLMSPSIMRRDQFYFTEKNEDESTRLYSLADLKGIRNDADFAKQYLAGYYGALPVLSDYATKNSLQND